MSVEVPSLVPFTVTDMPDTPLPVLSRTIPEILLVPCAKESVVQMLKSIKNKKRIDFFMQVVLFWLTVKQKFFHQCIPTDTLQAGASLEKLWRKITIICDMYFFSK